MWGCAGTSSATLWSVRRSAARCSTKHQGPMSLRAPGSVRARPARPGAGVSSSGGARAVTGSGAGGRTARLPGRLGLASARRGRVDLRRGTGGAGATGAGSSLPGPRSTSLTGLSLGLRGRRGEDRGRSCRASARTEPRGSRGSVGPHDLGLGPFDEWSCTWLRGVSAFGAGAAVGRPGSGGLSSIVAHGALTRPFSGRPGVQFSPFLFLSGAVGKASSPCQLGCAQPTALSTGGPLDISRGAHPCGADLWIT